PRYLPCSVFSLHDALPIYPSRLKHRLDPLIRDGETFFQGSRWLPFEDAPKPDVVRIPASHPLWLREVVPLSNRLSGDLTNHVHQDRKSTRLNSSHEWISYA